MDSKKVRKLSKATVATVIAASGVVIAMPQPSKAALYSDLNPLADYYQPVIELANRNIATGYSDGTFRPNQAITREDAAKMLALAIDVNIANPKNPGFKDVNVNNPNYRYIAALAEAGIINGFTDNTFKPKEYITRGQMAKIITLGFEFGMSQKLNNSFRDVSATNFAAYYIQTLLDLNITKGTTSVTFDPFKNVTRAQMATFIWRAEKADHGTPIYTVGDVSDNQIYINGVAYSIASHLRSILNASNKNILKGAYIEGTFSGKTLTNITKLTLNASGTSTRLLALDGNYTSFAGELVVNGSYIRLKNIDFTGRVEIATPPRRSLATLQNIRIASVTNFANFIDWDTPTEPKNEDFLNPSDNESLVDKDDCNCDGPSSSSKYKDRMANIQKYVDLESSDVRNLVVSSDRTFLKSDSNIDRLTVRGDVTNFEFYGDATAMYLDNDYNMTLYGVHDVDYAYKSSLKNVKLNSDSTYDYYYVTTKSGFTDIGEFAYINNAIIPKGTTVNTIFDDFETDEPQIGWIEDENGTPVSRDPVGDTVVLDLTAPEITQLEVKAGGAIADVTLTADEDGTYYYVVKKASEKAPTISEIKTGAVPLNGHGSLIMDEPVKFQVSGLESKTEYVIYAIVIDGQDNVSDKEYEEFETIDNRPPSLTPLSAVSLPGGKRIKINFNPSEAGTYYYYIRPISRSNAELTVDDVIKNYTYKDVVKTPGIIERIEFKHGYQPNNLYDLEPSRFGIEQRYEVNVVMVDESGNKSTVVDVIPVTMAQEDLSHPYIGKNNVRNSELRVVDIEKGIFEFDISEELDPESAKKVENYTLSGTGIVSISGRPEINPTKVELVGKNKVQLTIPSVTALVNGDTIRVTVSKNVKDLADNEFENEKTVNVAAGEIPSNVAVYKYSDTDIPKLEIKNLEASLNTYLVDFYTDKAGSYYYMILPTNYDINGKGITNKDFVNEFTSDKSGKFQTKGENDYKISAGSLVNQQGPAEVGNNKMPPVSKPTNLDAFTSYSIYMVVKDRSGNLSAIKDYPLIADTKPPLVSSYEISNLRDTNDGTIHIKLDVNEKGKLHVIPVPKYINGTLNKEYFTDEGELKDLPSTIYQSGLTNSEMRDIFFAYGKNYIQKNIEFDIFGTWKAISGLTPHQEYGMYIAVEDSVGNFTVFKRFDNKTDPIPQNEPAGDTMVTDFYTDANKPKFANDNLIVKSVDGQNYTLTFSEAIMRQKNKNTTLEPINWLDYLDITVENDGGTSVGFSVVGYKEGNSTTDPSQLIIKPNGTPSDFKYTFTVKMKDTAYDYNYSARLDDKFKFDLEDFGRFVYRDFSVDVSDFIYPVITDTRNAEAILSVPSKIIFESNEKLTYYYVVVSKGSKDFSIEEVVNTVLNKNSDASIINTLATGIGSVGITSSRATLKFYHPDRFKKDDIVFVVAEDKYGNRAIDRLTVGQ